MGNAARDKGLRFGQLPVGKLNKITDVPGVKVGHLTLADGAVQTGVTVVMPSEKNIFKYKLPAAAFVLNGFGKSCGLMQIEELGTLETPIALTNTLSVGACSEALVRYMTGVCRDDGFYLRSVNPVVCECNDGGLNDISLCSVRLEHLYGAVHRAKSDFDEGAVGAGRGTVCYGLKGGIGSASRLVTAGGREYTLGVLLQTNFGSLPDLTLCGKNIGGEIYSRIKTAEPPCDKGSVIAIVATDAPLSDRQLKRVLKRVSVGLARTGSFIGNGSGEVFLGFSTSNAQNPENGEVYSIETLNENRIDSFFRAVAEATEEAVINSLLYADDVSGFEKTVLSVNHYNDITEKILRS